MAVEGVSGPYDEPCRIRGLARSPSALVGGFRRSLVYRCSSSMGIRRVPEPISIVSTKGRTWRVKVVRLIPSAAAACVRV